MKKIPIKLRIVLWFGSFMFILLMIMFSFYFFFGRHLINTDNQGRLMHIVEAYALNLTEQGEYTIDAGEIKERTEQHIDEKIEDKIKEKKFNNGYEGIYITLFQADGEVIDGGFPDEFTYSSVKFDDKELQTFEIDGTKWNVYDIKLKNKENQSVWVRGVCTNDQTDNISNTLFLLVIAGLPLLVIWASIGGYFMLKKAFVPINQIITTAEEIGEGKDLTRRIQLGEGKDEIYKLANTFDRTFEKLEAYFENEKRFTSDASHELRTPVAVIISQCEYAIENIDNLDEAKQSFEQILDQSKKMSALISELLLLARVDNGTQNLNIEKINLSELLEIICEQQSEIAAEKNIEIITHIEPNIVIDGDETMLLRMIINLIENGICYGKESGHLTAFLAEEGNTVCLKIMDDGIGIEKEHINRIWERFYQVDPSRNAAKGNSGLGLPMVKWIITAHGGTIHVDSQLEIGTTFCVRLPKSQQNRN